MKQVMNQPLNRIDEQLALWQKRATKAIEEYGKDVVNDREFLKVRRDTYEDILRSVKFKDLSPDEKISYRLMRGQRRHLNKVLYPNRIVRALRNLIVLAPRTFMRVARTIGRLLNGIVAILTNTNGIQFNLKRRPALTNRSLLSPVQTQAQRTAPIKNVPTQQQSVEAVVPKRRHNSKVIQMSNGVKQGQHM